MDRHCSYESAFFLAGSSTALLVLIVWSVGRYNELEIIWTETFVMEVLPRDLSAVSSLLSSLSVFSS
jgi:hypothetical protein